MKRYVMAGLVLAVLTTVVVGTSLLGAEGAPVVLLGAALGGALGLVPDGSVAARAGGFVAGALLAWIGYVLRAAALPDSAAGRAVAALVVLGIGVVVVAAARGRVPAWSPLLGVAAVAGAYERVYAADPSAVASTSVETVTSVLLAAAVGLLATAFLAPASGAARAAGRTATSRGAHADDTATPVRGVPVVGPRDEGTSTAHPVFSSPAPQAAAAHPSSHPQPEA
ncbi:hypothetical protein [Cellulomonas uda]|uniref:Uncharacterized protein n=1 Tax=Cellulomonas uda TaxID=1714 RepID=A0A4Y3KEL0_CELUD|nr:hypothetical protein [Cellulomonas uda]NII65236.1 hypothetical protein [Cellulomonas uda]GEA81814.1 hypothetical protein CUD01_22580 [Cellulomonas uda]